mmetsp:Transcript_12172/g.19816  ORF Transcript_12172/g.19816 Transcript_12172/m.19816 type:complete len:205 (+) Transcript_12172:8474-9088(+)
MLTSNGLKGRNVSCHSIDLGERLGDVCGVGVDVRTEGGNARGVVGHCGFDSINVGLRLGDARGVVGHRGFDHVQTPGPCIVGHLFLEGLKGGNVRFVGIVVGERQNDPFSIFFNGVGIFSNACGVVGHRGFDHVQTPGPCIVGHLFLKSLKGGNARGVVDCSIQQCSSMGVEGAGLVHDHFDIVPVVADVGMGRSKELVVLVPT